MTFCGAPPSHHYVRERAAAWEAVAQARARRASMTKKLQDRALYSLNRARKLGEAEGAGAGDNSRIDRAGTNIGIDVDEQSLHTAAWISSNCSGFTASSC